MRLGCQRVARASEGPHGLCFTLRRWLGRTNLITRLGEARRGLKNSQRGTEGGGSEAETEFLLEGVPVLQSLLLL